MSVPPKQRPARPRPWEQGSADAASFGRWLRRQREVRKIALREVAETTNISIRYLEALEDDRFESLPAPVFAKGFLREYARYVGLDPDEVVNNYLAARQDATVEEAERVATAQRAKDAARRPWAAFIWVLVGLLILAGLGYWAYRIERQRQPPPAAPPPAASAPAPPVASAPPAQPVAAAPVLDPAPIEAPLRVTLDFTADSWVEVKVDGQSSFSELRVQGESVQLEARDEVVLSVNPAAGVHVEVNGRPFPLTPGVDGAVKDLRIDLALAAAPTPPQQ
jgi:transcriptional regulator with XRE-family HTH domain